MFQLIHLLPYNLFAITLNSYHFVSFVCVCARALLRGQIHVLTHVRQTSTMGPHPTPL